MTNKKYCNCNHRETPVHDFVHKTITTPIQSCWTGRLNVSNTMNQYNYHLYKHKYYEVYYDTRNYLCWPNLKNGRSLIANTAE